MAEWQPRRISADEGAALGLSPFEPRRISAEQAPDFGLPGPEDRTVWGQLSEIPGGMAVGAVGDIGGSALRGAEAVRFPWRDTYVDLLDRVERADVTGARVQDLLPRFEAQPSPLDAITGPGPRRRAEPASELASLDETIRTQLPSEQAGILRNALRERIRRKGKGQPGGAPDPIAEARAALPPEITERPLYQAGEAVSEAVEQAFPGAPGYHDSLGRTLGRGLGSVAAGVAVGLASGPAAPVTLGALFGAAGAGEAADRAIGEGAGDAAASTAARLGVLAGSTDIVPIEILLRRMPAPARRAVEAVAQRVGGERVAAFAGRVGLQTVVEAVQEGGQQTLQNLIAREVYKPEQELGEGVVPSAALGGGVGAIAALGREGVVALASRRSSSRTGDRARAVMQVPPPSPADEASPIPTTDIQAGREVVADAMAVETANRSLEAGGFTPIGQPVRLNDGTGRTVEGVVTDAETGQDGSVLGVTVSVQDARFGPDPLEIDMTLDELAERGVTLEGMPMPPSAEELAAQDETAAQDRQKAAEEDQREAEKRNRDLERLEAQIEKGDEAALQRYEELTGMPYPRPIGEPAEPPRAYGVDESGTVRSAVSPEGKAVLGALAGGTPTMDASQLGGALAGMSGTPDGDAMLRALAGAERTPQGDMVMRALAGQGPQMNAEHLGLALSGMAGSPDGAAMMAAMAGGSPTAAVEPGAMAGGTPTADVSAGAMAGRGPEASIPAGAMAGGSPTPSIEPAALAGESPTPDGAQVQAALAGLSGTPQGDAMLSALAGTSPTPDTALVRRALAGRAPTPTGESLQAALAGMSATPQGDAMLAALAGTESTPEGAMVQAALAGGSPAAELTPAALSGEPVKVFHGTRSAFDELDPSLSRSSEGSAAFFTTDRETADVYANEAAGEAEARVTERTVDPRDFVVFDGGGQRYGEGFDPEQVLEEARTQGASGVVFKNVRNDYQRYDQKGEAQGELPIHDIYAVLDREKISPESPADAPVEVQGAQLQRAPDEPAEDMMRIYRAGEPNEGEWWADNRDDPEYYRGDENRPVWALDIPRSRVVELSDEEANALAEEFGLGEMSTGDMEGYVDELRRRYPDAAAVDDPGEQGSMVLLDSGGAQATPAEEVEVQGAPLQRRRLYRADSDQYSDAGAFFGEDPETALAYADNPGFGGPVLTGYEADIESVIDADDWYAVAEALGEDVEDLRIRYSYSHEAVEDNIDELSEAGYEWAELKDSYPPGAPVVAALRDDLVEESDAAQSELEDTRTRANLLLSQRDALQATIAREEELQDSDDISDEDYDASSERQEEAKRKLNEWKGDWKSEFGDINVPEEGHRFQRGEMPREGRRRRVLVKRRAGAERAGPETSAQPARPTPGAARIRLQRRFTEQEGRVAGDIQRIGREVFGEGFRVQLAQSIEAPDGAQAHGAYDPANRIAYIALRADEAGMTGSLYHEGLHHLRNAGAFTDAQGADTGPWKTLVREAVNTWRKQYGIEERYGPDTEGMDAAQRERLMNEEAIAEALADYQTRGKETGFGPTVRSALNRLMNFFRRMANGLRGRGFQTWQDVFESDIATGAAGRRTDDQRRAELDRQLMTAWHGSPHQFDKFSTRAIGTGEGAQAFGHGLYFAGKREVAEHYRNELTRETRKVELRGSVVEDDGPSELLAETLRVVLERMRPGVYPGGAMSFEAARDREIGKLQDVVARGAEDSFFGPSARKQYENAIETLRRLKEGEIRYRNAGATYKVDLAPKEDEYLLWDEPFSAQSEKVKAAVTAMGEKRVRDEGLDIKPLQAVVTARYGARPEQATGESLYRAAEAGTTPREASEMLRASGIRGIKYRDASSRGQDDDATYNYVIFDDSDVAIEEVLLQRESGQASGGLPQSPAQRLAELRAAREPDDDSPNWETEYDAYEAAQDEIAVVEEARDALVAYTQGGESEGINRALRDGTGEDVLAPLVAPTTARVRVARGVDVLTDTQGRTIDTPKAGDVLADAGYASTAVGDSVLDNYAGDWELHLDLPRGTKAINATEDSPFSDQRELILPPGTEYTVERVDGKKVFARVGKQSADIEIPGAQLQRDPSAERDPNDFDDAASKWAGVDLRGAADAVIADKDRMGGFAENVRAQLKGTESVRAPGVEVVDKPTQADLAAWRRFFEPPSSWSKKFPAINALVKSGIQAEIDQSNRIQRLNKDWDRASKKLSRDEFADLTGVMFLGDAEAVTFTDDDLAQMPITAKVRHAYRASRKLLDKVGRFVEQHRRAMSLPLLSQRTKLIRQMAGARNMDRSAFRKLYTERANLIAEQRSGTADPETIGARIDALTEKLHGTQPPSEQYAEWAAEADRIQPRIDETKIRHREGYVPHKFFGRWRIFEKVPESDAIVQKGFNDQPFRTEKAARDAAAAAGGGEVVEIEGGYGFKSQWKHVAGEHGFWPSRKDAVRAASKLSRQGAELRVAPVEFTFPEEQATQLSDAAYYRFMGNVEAMVGLEGQDLQDAVRGVARKRFRRRIAGFAQYRKGAQGFSKNLDRVIRTHIGETVRYVSLDKLKFDAINLMEREGLSENRTTVQSRPVLAAAVQQWFKDVNGQKQVLEGQIDQLLNRNWVTPLRGGLAAGAMAYVASGATANPISPVIGAYIGWRVGRGLNQGGPFPTRAITSGMLGDMSHLKLGMTLNVMSALVNTTQITLNTLPVLGTRATSVGFKRFNKAVLSKIRGKPNADWRLMERHDIHPLNTFAEGTRHQFQGEGKLSKVSMAFFTSAEGLNRGVTFLGAVSKATGEGKSTGEAHQFAREAMRRTQFHYGAADKPELYRNVLLRVPAQFKNYVSQQIAFAFGLDPKKELPMFLMSLALLTGALGLPLLDLIDDITDQVADFSPIAMMKEEALKALARSELEGGIATFILRGAPGLAGVDMTGRAGMGDKFLPLTLRDWEGPWISTVKNAVRHGAEGASIEDHIRNVTPGFGNPLKVLEAQRNGGVMTSVWKRGRGEYEMTPDEMALKALGARPVREARQQDLRDIERRKIEKRRQDVRRYVDRYVKARQDGDTAEMRRVLVEAREEGVPLSRASIQSASRAMLLDRQTRSLKQLPRDMRREGARLREAIDQAAAP